MADITSLMPNKAFSWSFTNNLTSITSCNTYSIQVKDVSNGSSVPPYYMHAFVPSGLVALHPVLGSDPNNLSYTPGFSSATGEQTVLLSMVDSVGGSGGVAPLAFPVIYPESLPPSSCTLGLGFSPSFEEDIDFSISQSSSIQACDPFNVVISARQFGTPPVANDINDFQLSVVSIGALTVTNISLGKGNNAIDMVNKVDSGKDFLIAVSSALGGWGDTSGLLHSVGNLTIATSCPGPPSFTVSQISPSTSSFIPDPDPPSNSSKFALKIAIPIVGVFALGLFVVAVWYFRRRLILSLMKRKEGRGDLTVSTDDLVRGSGGVENKVDDVAARKEAELPEVPVHVEEGKRRDRDPTQLPVLVFEAKHQPHVFDLDSGGPGNIGKTVDYTSRRNSLGPSSVIRTGDGRPYHAIPNEIPPGEQASVVIAQSDIARTVV